MQRNVSNYQQVDPVGAATPVVQAEVHPVKAPVQVPVSEGEENTPHLLPVDLHPGSDRQKNSQICLAIIITLTCRIYL